MIIVSEPENQLARQLIKKAYEQDAYPFLEVNDAVLNRELLMDISETQLETIQDLPVIKCAGKRNISEGIHCSSARFS